MSPRAGQGGRGGLSGRGGLGGRAGLDRRDLRSILAQLDALMSRRHSARRSRSDEVEIARLRRLLAAAIDGWDGGEDEDERDGGGGEAERDEAEWDEAEWDEAEWDEAEWGGDPDGEDPDLEGAGGVVWSRRRWEEYAPAKPIGVEGGLTTRSRRGEIGETWWSKRFLAAVESTLVGGRSTRGRSYARRGQVVELTIGPGMIAARVQGTRRSPYKVRIAMPVADDGEWGRVVDALAAQAGYSARLLAGELPHEMEEVFAAVGVALFPSPTSRFSTECNCPDWANPCKHIAAACYLVAETFDRDPFALLEWRGREREAILSRLRELRGSHVDALPPEPPCPPPQVRALSECILGYWKAGPELAGVRARPEASGTPAAVLRQLPRGLLAVRGRDVVELLDPAYRELATGAERRALDGADVVVARRLGQRRRGNR